MSGKSNYYIDWRYIAGFVDGEGSFTKNGETDYRISVPQTHEWVLLAIKNFTKMGNICEPRIRKPHWKKGWTFYVAKQVDVLRFLRSVYPYLIVKKELARKLIPVIADITKRIRDRKEHLQKITERCKFLRRKGWSYRKIGKALKIDHGYARRIILFRSNGKEKWWA